jgi:hypothetical protein
MPSNKHPGFIRIVDRERREVRVEIPPFTDGASELPIAEIEYPIGDDSQNTEIRLVVGRGVWIEFIAGDPRRPLITGYRNPNTGNVIGTRCWNHDNFEINADEVFTVNAGAKIALIVGGTSIILTPESIAQLATALSIKATTTIEGATTIKGAVTQTGGDITSDGISVQHHKHPTAALGPPSEPSPS